jgi:hypothetical protein
MITEPISPSGPTEPPTTPSSVDGARRQEIPLERPPQPEETPKQLALIARQRDTDPAPAATAAPRTKLFEATSYPENLSGTDLKARTEWLLLRLHTSSITDAEKAATAVHFLGRVTVMSAFVALKANTAWPELRKLLLLRFVDSMYFDKMSNTIGIAALKLDHSLLQFWERLSLFNRDREIGLDDAQLWSTLRTAVIKQHHAAAGVLAVTRYNAERVEERLQELDKAFASEPDTVAATTVNVANTITGDAVVAAPVTTAAPPSSAAAQPLQAPTAAPVVNVYVSDQPKRKPWTDRKSDAGRAAANRNPNPLHADMVCYGCRRLGHIKRNCPNPKKG